MDDQAAAAASPRVIDEHVLDVYHGRANHEDNLFLSRTSLFLSFNGFMAVAVGLVNDQTMRVVFAAMAIALDVLWARWAPRSRRFIRELRNAGAMRADQVLWQKLFDRKEGSRGNILDMVAIIPRLLVLGWAAIALAMLYRLLHGAEIYIR